MLLSVVGSCLAKFAAAETFSYLQTDASTPNNVVSICTELKYANYTWMIQHAPFKKTFCTKKRKNMALIENELPQL